MGCTSNSANEYAAANRFEPFGDHESCLIGLTFSCGSWYAFLILCEKNEIQKQEIVDLISVELFDATGSKRVVSPPISAGL